MLMALEQDTRMNEKERKLLWEWEERLSTPQNSFFVRSKANRYYDIERHESAQFGDCKRTL